MDQEKIKEYVESVREELHELIDKHIEDFVKRMESGESVICSEHAWSLRMPFSYFKGTKPVSVCLPDGEKVFCRTWREAVSVILHDCNRNAELHERLTELSGKVAGRERTILGKTGEGMNKPIHIDDDIYFESFFDTEYLLKMMKERVLDKVGYNSDAVRLQIYEPKKEFNRVYETAQPETEEETDEGQGFSLTM